MKRIAALSLLFLITGAAHAAKHRVLFNRYRVPETALFVSDAEGKNERPLIPHQASEYSPSVSLDGKWVAFTVERGGQADIYRVRPDGSGMEQLTNDPAFDDQAAPSPDGSRIAFVSTRDGGWANIWLLDTATRKLTNLTHNPSGNFRPSWSPDGNWIAFSSDRDANAGLNPGMWEHLQSTGIYVMHPDGSALRRLTRVGGVAGSPAWSADGSKLLFYETDESGAYMAKSGNSRTEIVQIDFKTGERLQHTASNETKLSPQWLPDGKIAYITRGGNTAGLKVRDSDRKVTNLIQGTVRQPRWFNHATQIVYERILKPAMTEHLIPTSSLDPGFELFLSEPFPSYSRDGKRLIYSEYGNNGTNVGNTTLQIMNADGSDERALFHKQGYSAFDAEFSPAGDSVVFGVGRYFRSPGAPPAQLALINPDGSGFRTLVDDDQNSGFPSFSPDGKRVVFKHGKQLAIVTVADGKIVPITDGSHHDNFPSWSPKGDVIAFTSDRSGTFDLYTIHPDGTGLHRLTNDAWSDAHPSWSDDGEWVVFTSARRGFKDEMALYDGVPQPYGEIYAMHADGTEVHQLTDNKWEDSTPGWMPEGQALRTQAR